MDWRNRASTLNSLTAPIVALCELAGLMPKGASNAWVFPYVLYDTICELFDDEPFDATNLLHHVIIFVGMGMQRPTIHASGLYPTLILTEASNSLGNLYKATYSPVTGSIFAVVFFFLRVWWLPGRLLALWEEYPSIRDAISVAFLFLCLNFIWMCFIIKSVWGGMFGKYSNKNFRSVPSYMSELGFYFVLAVWATTL